jgi:hypothetical protein
VPSLRPCCRTHDPLWQQPRAHRPESSRSQSHCTARRGRKFLSFTGRSGLPVMSVSGLQAPVSNVRLGSILLKNSILVGHKKTVARLNRDADFKLGGEQQASTFRRRASDGPTKRRWTMFPFGTSSDRFALRPQFRVFQQNRSLADFPGFVLSNAPLKYARRLCWRLEKRTSKLPSGENRQLKFATSARFGPTSAGYHLDCTASF